MATVPEYQRRVSDRPVNQQAINVQTNPDAFGAGIGRATQQLGQGVFDVASAVDFKDQLTADADAREAFDRYRAANQQFLMDPNNGVLNQTGANSLGAEEQITSTQRSMRDEFGRGLSGRAQKAYNTRVDDMEFQTDERILSHTSAETRNYITNQRQSTINGYVEEAVTNYNNEELFARNLGQALAEQTELAKLEGWDEATQRTAAERLISSTIKGRIVQTATNDPLAAEGLLNNSRDVLSAEDEHALDTGMKQLIIDAKVNQFVQPFVRSGMGAAADPYLAAVTRAESGGNPNAANNRANPGVAAADGSASSALGSKQFLRGTYLDEVRKLRAAGGAAWADGMTDDEIAATRTNPAMEGEVFDFFRTGNQEQIAAAGFAVTPVSEYSFHHFGDGGGPALLRAARDNPSASMEQTFGASTSAILASNPQFRGKTAGEAVDWLTAHLGADDETLSGGNFFNAAEALAQAAAIEDPELQAATMAKISNLMTLQDRARAADRQNAQETAWNNYVETGDQAVPMGLKLRMGQGGWAAFQQSVENDIQGIDVTDEGTWSELMQLSADPKAFADVNLQSHRPSLSEADWRSFVQLQTAQAAAQEAAKTGSALATADARNNMNFGQMFTASDDIYRAMVDDTSAADLKPENRKQRVEFERNLMKLAQDFFDREERAPNTQEVRELATTLAMPVTFTQPNAGMFGGSVQTDGFFFGVDQRPSGSSYDVTYQYDDIPVSDRTAIAASIMASNGGVLPTPEQITDAYENQRLMSAGLPPNIDIGQVPEGLISSAKTRNPEITDDELVELYQVYLMETR